jgi:hypothetical protein
LGPRLSTPDEWEYARGAGGAAKLAGLTWSKVDLDRGVPRESGHPR